MASSNKSITTDDGFYMGDFNDANEPHGTGTFYWNNGDVYEGEWQIGKRHGHGKMKFANGTEQEGEWSYDSFNSNDWSSDFSSTSDDWMNDFGTTVENFDDEDDEGDDSTISGSDDYDCDDSGDSGYDWTNDFGTTMAENPTDVDDFPMGNDTYNEVTDNDEGEDDGLDFTDLENEILDAATDLVDDEDEFEEISEDSLSDVEDYEYDGGIYAGQINSDGLPHGFGSIRWDEYECTYEGDWENGAINGRGKKTWDSGDVFEGTFVDGQLSGEAHCNFSDGSSYDGEYENDQINGHGTLTMENGDVYEGDFRENTFFGKGKYTYADGNFFDGEWEDGAWRGSGTYTTSENGESVTYYSSYWSDCGESEMVIKTIGGRETDGSMTGFEFTPDEQSDVYDGEKNFKGQPHGRGKMFYADGSTYDGGWAYGEWYKQGTYTLPDGKVYKGYFSSTKRSLNVTLFLNGRAIHGTMTDGDFRAD